uniref:DZIP3-like HEPN domain-containing protein n=1 Tax=Magallana gigas TaxID=29159 RepID=A0A8W8P4M3_MAGGI
MDLEDPRQSSTHYFNRGKPAENFLRLCRLILTICTDILRDVLSRYIKPADLRSELDKNRHRLEKIMNTEQKKLIYPANGNKALAAKHLDISVMYIILRNICNIPNHQNGWGNPPKTGDNSIAACIEKIRIQRNEISAHHTNGEIEETEFNNRWTELEEAVLEIERQLTGGDLYERGVRYFLRCDLNFGQAEKPIQVEHPQVDVDMSDVGNSEAGKGGLDLFYDDVGAGVRFAELFNELAEKIPPTKISQIQDLIEKSGFRNIQVHVLGNLTEYSSERIKQIKDTVAAIVGCTSEEILVGGFTHSNSFFVILTIKYIYYSKLLDMGQQDRDKLRQHNIDFLIVDLNVILLDPWKDYVDKRAVTYVKEARKEIKRRSMHSKAGGLYLFYDDSGAGVRFAELFNELAEKIPPTKINQIKDLIESSCSVDNMASLEHAKTARDCLRFLKKEGLFIPTDVIFIQYLLKKIDCRDLFDKCYRYAEAQKALCYYEKPPESGFRNIQVHVLGNLTEYSSERIKKIKDTVAAIVGCTSEEILVGGFTHSNSFFVILAIKDIYYSKLLDMGQQDRDKLRQLNIDFLIVDLKEILLDPWKDS